MPYPALTDRRMPYDADGTLVYTGTMTGGASDDLTSGELIELNDDDFASIGHDHGLSGGSFATAWWFFPEQREVTAYYMRSGTTNANSSVTAPEGSNDTANGLDGTWEVASVPGGTPGFVNLFSWRDGIKAVSFVGPKKSIRIDYSGTSPGNGFANLLIAHLYGEAAGGQMTHDLIFTDPDLGSAIEFPAPEDFGDQPLGTTVVRPFRIKNISAARTATNVNIQCNDADFTIAESDSGPWVPTINIASLAPGAESATMYVRCTTPAPGAALRPRFSRIVVVAEDGAGGNFFG